LRTFLYNEFTKITGFITSVILIIQHGEDVFEKLKKWTGFRTFIERAWIDRRNTVMEISDILKYEAALPEIKAWLLASMALVEKIESIRAAQVVPSTTKGA
jgi:hypothetical protein